MIPSCTLGFRRGSLAGILGAAVVLLILLLWALMATESGATSSGSGEGNGSGSGTGPGAGGIGGGPGSGFEGTGLGGGGDGTEVGQPGSPDAAGPITAQGTELDESANQFQLAATGPAPVYGFETNPDPVPVVVAPVAVAPRGTASSGPSGTGQGGGGGGGKGAEFMGSKAAGESFVYIVDYSGSMGGGPGSRLVHAKTELQKSVDRLDSHVEFYIFVFESNSRGMPAEGMVKATPANKTKFVGWAINEPGGGSTNPTDALAQALKMEPDAIFLMTDGGFDDSMAVQMALQTNWNHQTKVNTIAFHDRSAATDLEDIASQTGGSYRFIPPP